MTEPEAYTVLTELFREVFADDTLVLRPDLTVYDVDGWDSLTNLNLIVAVEARFNFKLNDGEIDELENVGELVQIIMARSPA